MSPTSSSGTVRPQGVTSVGPDEENVLLRWLRRVTTPESGKETAAMIGAGFVPGVGMGMDAADVAVGLHDRDPLRVGIGALGAALPFVGGPAIKALGRNAKNAGGNLWEGLRQFFGEGVRVPVSEMEGASGSMMRGIASLGRSVDRAVDRASDRVRRLVPDDPDSIDKILADEDELYHMIRSEKATAALPPASTQPGAKPLDIPLYHGTPHQFKEFKSGGWGDIWFTSDPKEASRYFDGAGEARVRAGELYAPNIHPVQVRAENPLYIKHLGEYPGATRAREMGHDAVVVKMADGRTHVATFDPKNIVSRFSPPSDSYASGGQVRGGLRTIHPAQNVLTQYLARGPMYQRASL